MPSAPIGAALAGQPATVMGLGLFGGGSAVARHLHRLGARVTVTDLRGEAELAPSLEELAGLGLRAVLGRHEEADFTRAALVVANPAVPPSSPYLALARQAGVPITSEIALFLDATPARVAAVTGTQGKSSTCHALAQLLAGAGERAWLGGNIGRSLLDDLPLMRAGDFAVVELSSYQLEQLPEELGRERERSALEVVGIVNVLADHIERHGSREAYARAKLRILEVARPGGSAIVERALVERFAQERTRAALGSLRRCEPPGEEGRGAADLLGAKLVAAAARAPFRAGFQRANALFAALAARLLGLAEEALIPGLGRLEGLPHRLEHLGLRSGHPVWDNGVSTTPDSTVSALLALPPGLTLLCGGKPKALDLDELLAVAAARARRVVVFGAAAASWVPLLRAAGAKAEPAAGVSEAVELAFRRMEPGEGLLFSPAAASFDAWPNFRARAEAFRRALPPPEPAS